MYNAELSLYRSLVTLSAQHICVLVAFNKYPVRSKVFKKEVEDLYNTLMLCAYNAKTEKVEAKYLRLAQKLHDVYYEQEQDEQTAQKLLNFARAISR